MNVLLKNLLTREQQDLIKELKDKFEPMKKHCGTQKVTLNKKSFDLLYDAIAYPQREHKEKFFWNDLLIEKGVK